tara:strand:+ start:462 stop:887 length:426 start_codon:yes stop_codon:yes gene_type:complete
MALEHNLLYFFTRASATKAVSVTPPSEKIEAFPVTVVTDIKDIRLKADRLGLSLPVLLRRMHDPDKIFDIAPDNTYSFIRESVDTDIVKDKANNVTEDSKNRGIAIPLIPTDYYVVLYSSYINHLKEMDSLTLNKITGFGG